jgi:mersacidin/lichenicidin family type 2 lantibiotic
MKFDIVRAWKDENYRQSLSDEQLLALPANPAGEQELSDSDLDSVVGGSPLLSLLNFVTATSLNILASPLQSTCFANSDTHS